MIMGCYQCLRSDFRDEISQYRFGKCKSIVGRRSASKFVEDDETFFRRIIQYVRDFDHFGHEGGLVFRYVVSTAYTGKDGIHYR